MLEVRTTADTHEFTLLVRGADLLDDQNLDALFEAGCDDATFAEQDGVFYANFHRDAGAFAEAVWSGLMAIESAVPSAVVFRVQGDELVTAAVIAERTGRTRESIRLLIEAKRGPGGFPAPVSWVSGKTRLWEWEAVSRWFHMALGEEVAGEESAAFIAALNGALEVRARVTELSDPAEREVLGRLLEKDAEALEAV